LSVAKRLLVAVGQAAGTTEDLPFGVRELIDAADEILVITPALPTRFEWLSSATDKARMQADERLGQVLAQLEELGSSASGEIGADDPLLAFEDALRDFPADHILVSLRAEGAVWLAGAWLDPQAARALRIAPHRLCLERVGVPTQRDAPSRGGRRDLLYGLPDHLDILLRHRSRSIPLLV
jgi:hypothetical protein